MNGHKSKPQFTGTDLQLHFERGDGKAKHLCSLYNAHRPSVYLEI